MGFYSHAEFHLDFYCFFDFFGSDFASKWFLSGLLKSWWSICQSYFLSNFISWQATSVYRGYFPAICRLCFSFRSGITDPCWMWSFEGPFLHQGGPGLVLFVFEFLFDFRCAVDFSVKHLTRGEKWNDWRKSREAKTKMSRARLRLLVLYQAVEEKASKMTQGKESRKDFSGSVGN